MKPEDITVIGIITLATIFGGLPGFLISMAIVEGAEGL